MAISIILGHPNQGSFNHAIAAAAAATLRGKGHEINFHDLYAEGFEALLTEPEMGREPRLDEVVQKHCREITTAEGIVIVHPNWWAMPPAILKGWMDRVLRVGTAYKFVTKPDGEGAVQGLLPAKAAVVFTTSNTPREQELALYGDPLDNLWKKCILGFCGVENVFRRNFESVIMSSPEQRKGWLEEVKSIVDEKIA